MIQRPLYRYCKRHLFSPSVAKNTCSTNRMRMYHLCHCQTNPLPFYASFADLQVIQTGGRKGVTPNTPSRKEMTGARTPLRGSSTVEMKNHLPGAESIAGQRSPCHVEQGTPLTPGSTPRQYQEQNERAMGVRRKASFTSAQDPKAEKSKRSPGASWKQCRGGGHMSSFSDVSTRIQDLADYLQLHVRTVRLDDDSDR